MAKEVLLARPHPFIRKPMSDFLTRLGFTPTQDAPRSRPAAVVVSSSVTSEHGAFEDVLESVKKAHSGVPLIVATLVKPELAKGSIGRTLASVFPGKKVGYAGEGTAGDILVVRPDDLANSRTGQLFRQMLK